MVLAAACLGDLSLKGGKKKSVFKSLKYDLLIFLVAVFSMLRLQRPAQSFNTSTSVFLVSVG